MVLLVVVVLVVVMLAVAKISTTNLSVQNTSLLSERLVFFLSACIFIFAPLIRGGNRQVSLVVLFALSSLVLATIFAEFSYLKLQNVEDPSSSSKGRSVYSKVLLFILLSSPIWLGCIYLIPLPVDVWRSLAGREIYLNTMDAMKIAIPNTFPLTLSANGTWASIIAGVPLVAMFMAALYLPMKAVKSLLVVLLFCAILQVLLSVLQLGFGANSAFYFDLESGGVVIGSFANRNHLANFLVLLLPVCFCLFFDLSKSKDSRDSSSFLESKRQSILILLVFLGFSFVLMLFATLSRGGIISGFVALGLSMVVYFIALNKNLTNKQRFLYLGLAIVFILLALVTIGLEGIQSKLGTRLITDADVRNSISRSTFEAATVLWPWGSGPGSFEAVFPRFHPVLNIGYIEYAHNDHVQILMELGVFGAILIAVFVLLVIQQIFSFIRLYRFENRLSKETVIQCFCGVSVLAFMLHCWVEFNMHIPVLAITAAFLCGIFLRDTGFKKRK